MWKLLFVAVVVVGLSDAKFELKGRARQLVKKSLEAECERYGQMNKATIILESAMRALDCMYNSFDVDKEFEPLNDMSTAEKLVEAAAAICNRRSEIHECYSQLLDILSPCFSPRVREQFGPMKDAVQRLFEYVCEKDLMRFRGFAVNGGLECLNSKADEFSTCASNVTDLFTALPEDTTNFEAIDACHKYDAMVSCTLTQMKQCTHESSNANADFTKGFFSLFREGTYCHVTAPIKQTNSSTGISVKKI